MKKFLAISAFLSFTSFAFADAAPNPAERDVAVSISEAYVPAGFDINSDVYVAASGMFPNGCYRWKSADVNHPTQFTHEVKALANVKQGMCLMVLVPFNKEIKLGKFIKGDHTIRFLNGDGTYLEKKVSIE